MGSTLLAYKNFSKVSHIGLGVTALATMKVLRRNGLHVTAQAYLDFPTFLKNFDGTKWQHCVISAVWYTPDQLATLVNKWPETKFVLLCHSNVAFLQADPNAFQVIMKGLALQDGTHNFHVAGNSARFVNWLSQTYHKDVLHLPNLYDLQGMGNYSPRIFQSSTLKTGCFCASRIQKNILTAAAASLYMAKTLQKNLEFHINVNRDNSTALINSITQMFQGHGKLVLVPWASWPDFRTIVRSLHLGIQVSTTESFNNVVADGVYVGVASVCSEPIVEEWAPASWLGPVDNAVGVGNVGIGLLHNPRAVMDGRTALTKHVNAGVTAWKAFLNS